MTAQPGPLHPPQQYLGSQTWRPTLLHLYLAGFTKCFFIQHSSRTRVGNRGRPARGGHHHYHPLPGAALLDRGPRPARAARRGGTRPPPKPAGRPQSRPSAQLAAPPPALPRAGMGRPRTPRGQTPPTPPHSPLWGRGSPRRQRETPPPPPPRGRLEGRAGSCPPPPPPAPRHHPPPSTPFPRQPPGSAPRGGGARIAPPPARPPPARRYLGAGAELGRPAGAERPGRGLQVDGGALRGLHARGAAAQPAVEVRRHHRDGSLGRQDGDGQALPGAAAGAPAAAAAGCLEERRDAAGLGAAAGAAAHQHGRGAAPHRQLLPGERRGERSGIVTRRAAAGPRPPGPRRAAPRPAAPLARGWSSPAGLGPRQRRPGSSLRSPAASSGEGAAGGRGRGWASPARGVGSGRFLPGSWNSFCLALGSACARN